MGVHSRKSKAVPSPLTIAPVPPRPYRKAIDDAWLAVRSIRPLMGTLENLAHRGYTEGFLRRHNHSEYQNYDYGYLGLRHPAVRRRDHRSQR